MTSSTLTPETHQVPAIFRVNVRAIWRYLLTQPASFWLINFYLFIEYVRPQQVWPVIDVLPWGQTTLILATIALLLEGKFPRLPTVAGPLLMLFSLIVLASSTVAYQPEASYAKWQLYYSWVLIYLLITNIINTEKRFFIFVLAFLLYSFKMSQHGVQTWVTNGFGFSSWGATGAPGWFQNSGEFGIQMCVFLPLVVEFSLGLRRYWGKWTKVFFYALPVTALISIVASSSRGALVGAAAVGIWWVARSKHRVRGLLAIAVVAAVTWVVVPPEQKARFSTAGEDKTSVARIDRWKEGVEIANEYPVLGLGYANWGAYFNGHLPHNIFIEAWAELGYTGLLGFLALIGATFWVNHDTRRMLREIPTVTGFLRHAAYGLDGALIGYMASGFFITVLYYPYFWINLAMTVSLNTAARAQRRRQVAYVRTEAAAAQHPGGAVPVARRTGGSSG